MSPELDKLLSDRYPKIFALGRLRINQTRQWRGFSCDDGWFNLIDQLCQFIQFYLDHNNRDGKIAQTEAVQVKEKLGTLRFYVSGGDDYLQGAINFAEHVSATICEITGEPGKLCWNGGCYKTLSPAKAIELGYTPKSRNWRSE
jgi:hypothetical protein